MEKSLSLPGEKGYDKAYELAYKLACDQLTRIEDIEEQCRRSGARYDSSGRVVIQYLSQSYLITVPEGKVLLSDGDGEVPIRDKILILHYFISAKGIPLANKLVSFRELAEGTVYAPTFDKRTIKPLLENFGKDPKLLLKVSEKLGGRKVDYGDVGVTINAFPYVPITIVIWGGDEEFTPQGNVLFDATISDYLSTEDITILCETITWRLIKSLK